MTLAELAGLPEEGFAAPLRAFPREKSPEEVFRAGRLHDAADGDWINPHAVVHHYEESGH